MRPASIHELYLARGRGQVPPFTTPAMNIRVLSYDSARAVFRAAKRLDVGALICEIARSEIGYTEQRPAEYVAVMTAAALREGFTGPLFIQGDHVQVNAKKYAVDAETELQAIRTLIEEELHAGFYNIDVDTSTLVDLSQPTLDAQQRVNYERAADLTKFIRDREPEGVTVSVGAASLTIGMFLLAFIGPGDQYSALLLGMFILGAGVGLFYSSVTTAGSSSSCSSTTARNCASPPRDRRCRPLPRRRRVPADFAGHLPRCHAAASREVTGSKRVSIQYGGRPLGVITLSMGVVEFLLPTGLRAMSSCARPTPLYTKPRHKGVIASRSQSPYRGPPRSSAAFR